ncbi:MAG: peptidyl-prolyl cis-trans isomerase [Verrucomicrobiae bacterium]|nr:peptidyl-prolyl cis-trans isomerase [Verrucomicrobiae bacterium]
MKFNRAGIVAVLICSLGFTLPGQLPPNAIMAIVHDTVITRQEVDELARNAILESVRRYARQPEVLNQKVAEVRAEALERLIEDRLILHEFATAGYILPESLVEEYVQERIRAEFGDRVTLTKSLQEEGLTTEKYRQRVRDRFIIQQMRYKNVSGEIIISPSKIENYYLAHQDEFRVEEQVKLRMIVLGKPSAEDADQVRELGREIRLKLQEGAAFTEMAAIYSQGRQGREGGDWGWVQRFNEEGASVLRPELAEVAFSLKPGEFSEVIDLPEAVYLMLIEDKRSNHVRPLSEVRDEIEAAMLTQERERLQRLWVERLKSKTYVRYF